MFVEFSDSLSNIAADIPNVQTLGLKGGSRTCAPRRGAHRAAALKAEAIHGSPSDRRPNPARPTDRAQLRAAFCLHCAVAARQSRRGLPPRCALSTELPQGHKPAGDRPARRAQHEPSLGRARLRVMPEGSGWALC